MIQRKQTIFLLISAVLSALTFCTPLIAFSLEGSKDIEMTLTALSFQTGGAPVTAPGTWYLIFIAAMATLMAFLAIFGYKNRKQQVRQCYSVILANALLIGSVALYAAAVLQAEGTAPIYKWGIALPVAAIAFDILAIRGIKHDEALVRAADRLR